jgi:hypothetical protein
MSLSIDQFYRPLPNIALFAKMRSGKDEVYTILKAMGFHVERVAFGDVMKERFFETFPAIPKDPKPIIQLIQYGEAMRKIDSLVWVTPTMNRMKLRTDILAQAGLTPPSFVVTDVRNQFEYDACKRAGFVMVRVHASEEVRVKRMLELGEKVSREILDAPTETALDRFEYDHLILNESTKQELAHNVTEFVYQLQTKRGN